MRILRIFARNQPIFYHFMKRLYVALLGLIACSTIYAAIPTSGKVYRFRNNSMTDYYLDANGTAGDVKAKTLDDAVYNQSWYVTTASSGVYYIRSLQTGYYLSSPTTTYAHWTAIKTPDNTCKFKFAEDSYGLKIRRSDLTGDSQYLHCDASHNLVLWYANSGSIASYWTPVEVSMTSAQITAALNAADAVNNAVNNKTTYANALSQLFSDNACTILKVSNPESTTAYSQLPAELKTMVTKVRTGNWSESTGGWDSQHAKRFRVQSYKPYSRGSEGAQMLSMIPFTNMNNPTGIITTGHQSLYVMVDTEPATGSTLYITPVPDGDLYNSWDSGTQLHAGLNIIPTHSKCDTYYIYYTVETYNTSTNRKSYSLANFPAIKIHIEGGEVNGFFQLGTDSNADWTYYRTRAKHTMFPLLGRFVNLNMHFNKTQTVKDGETITADGLKDVCGDQADVNAIVQGWDNMCLVERLLAGLQPDADTRLTHAMGLFERPPSINYHDYFNNKIMAVTGAGNIYMNSGNWRTQYNVYTMSGILYGVLWSGDGLWGPAHEFGHAMQDPMNIHGTTEVSNNIFSNVAVYCNGKYTSRADYPSNHRQQFLNNTLYLDREAWGMTRMFWQLFLYYHVAGHNRQFYPLLLELLRNDPLNHDGDINERYDMLHFAKKCCIASGDDLTEFFRSWGFFVPFDRTLTDYTTHRCYLTQSDINAVISEISALRLPKNTAILFIDDRPGSDRMSYPSFNKLMCGNFGGLDAYLNPKASNAGYYIDGTSITITGNPGAGMAIYDTAGNLLDFTNNREFTVSDALAAKIKAGTAIVKAVDGNNNVTTMSQTENPQNLYTLIDQVLRLVDEEEKTVGMYSGTATYELRRAYADKSLPLNELRALYDGVVNNPDAVIKLRPGKPHHLTNRAYSTRSLGLDASKQLIAVATDMEAMEQTWTPIDLGNGKYALKNNAESRYAGAVTRSTIVQLTTTETPYTIERAGNDDNYVYMSLSYNGNSTTALHSADTRNYSVVGWDASANPSQWIIQYMGEDMEDTGIEELREWVEKTNELLTQVGTVQLIDEPVELTGPMLSSNAKSTSGIYAFTSWDVILDNNFSTLFVSDRYNNSTDGLDHYLQVDMGEDAQIRSFSFSYGTRNTSASSFAPKEMTVYASADGEEWIQITKLTDLPQIFPTTYQSETLTSPIPARYFRFMVTNANGPQSNDHYVFGMSEFGMSTSGTEIAINGEKYPFVTDEMFSDAYESASAGNALLEGRSTPLQRLSAIDDIKAKYAILLAAVERSNMAGIDEVFAPVFDPQSPAFDMMGRRVEQPTLPGIYIQNGHKFIVK